MEEKELQNKWNVKWDENSYITLEGQIDHYIDHIESHLHHFRARLVELETS